MKTLRQALVLLVTFLLLGCNMTPAKELAAASNDKKFKKFPENYPPRWCLRNADIVIEPRNAPTWPNSGEVALGNVLHQSDCDKHDIFADGDKLYIRGAAAGRFLLKITDSNDNKKYPPASDDREWLPLDREKQAPYRYLYHDGTPNDFYVLFGEAVISGQLIKYYRIEAFADADKSDECLRERPSYVDSADPGKNALVKITSSFTCPNDLAAKAKRQTGVGGGGEED